ncbi:MAG: hypothetical protein QGG25_10900, partial [Phycisphaerae bacterium]|nr:hypothetical protein [Phycisphaerae bacterium]
MLRYLTIITVVTLASLGATVSAEVVNFQPGQFAVLAGKKLETGSSVSVYGNVGLLSSDMDFGSGVKIYGDIHANDDVKIGSDSVVGSIYASD